MMVGDQGRDEGMKLFLQCASWMLDEEKRAELASLYKKMSLLVEVKDTLRSFAVKVKRRNCSSDREYSWLSKAFKNRIESLVDQIDQLMATVKTLDNKKNTAKPLSCVSFEMESIEEHPENNKKQKVITDKWTMMLDVDSAKLIQAIAPAKNLVTKQAMTVSDSARALRPRIAARSPLQPHVPRFKSPSRGQILRNLFTRAHSIAMSCFICHHARKSGTPSLP